MAAHKFLKILAGLFTEESAVESSAGAADEGKIPALNASGVLDSTIVNSKASSAGAGDAGKVVALDGAGKIDTTMMPTGIGADTGTVTASEALANGDYVNIYDATGGKCRKADASTSGKEAHGFVLAAVDNGNPATIYFEGTNTGVTGQTPGPVFLSTTPGLGAATPPTGAGNAVQSIGVAVSATAVNFQYNRPVILV